MNKIWITGLGIVSPVGSDVAAYWRSMLEEETRPNQVYGPLADRIRNRYLYTCRPSRDGEAVHGRTQAIILDSARQALRDAGLDDFDRLRAGVVIGTSIGDEGLLEEGRDRERPEAVRDDYPFQAAASVAQQLGFWGPNTLVSNACTSALYAIDLAAGMIRQGEADVMLAGGAESESLIAQACFNRIGALDEEGTCRPFDKDRKGTVLAEGAAMVLLESQAHARARGITAPYGAYKGSGWSCDAYQPTAPEPSGEQIERALRECLQYGGVAPDEVDCVLPHGTGTPLNDSVEAVVLARLFGASARPPLVTAIKSKLGHSGGASGAFSIVTACLILRHGRVPPTANLKNRDREVALSISVAEPASASVRNVVVNSYAFGGSNISVVVGRP